MKQIFSRYATSENGAVYVMVLGMSVMCFAFIGLMFDAGRVYIEHTRLQHYADRVSIAAALELDGEEDAITRARNVINSDALAERAIYATKGGESFEISEIKFFTGMPAPDDDEKTLDDFATESGAEARYVMVEVEPRSLPWSLFALQTTGLADINISLTSIASQTQPEFGDVDFIFAIDNSQSMLMGATQADQDLLEDLHGCAFACHISYTNSSGREIIEDPVWLNGELVTLYENGVANGVRYRIDAANEAIDNAILVANERSITTGATVNFEVYTFALDLAAEPVVEGNVVDILAGSSSAKEFAPGQQAQVVGTAQDYAPGRQSDVSAKEAAPGQQKKSTTLVELEPFNPGQSIDFNQSNRFTTDPEFALADLQTVVNQRLLDTSDADLVVVIVTDGVASYYRGGSRSTRARRIFRASDCNFLKNEQVQVGIIYTKYLPVQNSRYHHRQLVRHSRQFTGLRLTRHVFRGGVRGGNQSRV